MLVGRSFRLVVSMRNCIRGSAILRLEDSASGNREEICHMHSIQSKDFLRARTERLAQGWCLLLSWNGTMFLRPFIKAECRWLVDREIYFSRYMLFLSCFLSNLRLLAPYRIRCPMSLRLAPRGQLQALLHPSTLSPQLHQMRKPYPKPKQTQYLRSLL